VERLVLALLVQQLHQDACRGLADRAALAGEVHVPDRRAVWLALEVDAHDVAAAGVAALDFYVRARHRAPLVPALIVLAQKLTLLLPVQSHTFVWEPKLRSRTQRLPLSPAERSPRGKGCRGIEGPLAPATSRSARRLRCPTRSRSRRSCARSGSQA